MSDNRLLFFTNKSIEGPWLLDVNDLREIDNIIMEQWDRLEHRRENLLNLALHHEFQESFLETGKLKEDISEDTNERIRLYRNNHPDFSKSYKRVQIYYSDSEFSCDNFDTALAQRSLVEKNPEGFSISISSGGIEGVISINKDNGFEISLGPEELPEVQEIYTAIWLWADENGPSWWQRWWWIAANMGLKFYLYLLGLPISLWAIFSLVAQNNNLIEMRRRAEQLLSAGVTNSNMADVIELLLEMEVRNTASIEILPWMKALLIAFVIIGIVVRIRPKVAIGIGRGTRRLRIWRIWLKLIGITIPALIFGSFVWPFIVKVISGFLSSP